MNICVAGWYFNKEFLQTLAESKYHSFVVKHREGWSDKGGMDHKPEIPEPIGFSTTYNVGLEFGCYDWYLKNKWQSGDVLFIHDDNEITENALDLIASLDRDQVFLFTSQQEAMATGMAHGRAFFCSEKFLKRLKEDGGFWYDEGNHGDVEPTSADKPNYHNSAIQIFRRYLLSLPKEYTVNRTAIVPGLKCGYRGRL